MPVLPKLPAGASKTPNGWYHPLTGPRTLITHRPIDELVHWVYIVRCRDDTYYTGYATDLDRRLAEHNDGTGAKYTRGRTPVTLVHSESYESRSAALRREHEIKQLDRSEKDALVRE